MTQALAHYSTAQSFCGAAHLALSNPQRLYASHDIALILPFHHLMGFSLELYLKAFLSAYALSEDDLKKYGHNLTALLERCHSFGMNCPEALILAPLFPHHHKPFGYRYSRANYVYEFERMEYYFYHFSQLDFYVHQAIHRLAQCDCVPFSCEQIWRLPPQLGKLRVPQ